MQPLDPHQAAICSLCLNLCMDVCPVSVHSGRADLMPNVKLRSAAAALEIRPGEPVPALLHACTDCGACTEHCALDIPVAAWLERAAEALRRPPSPRPAAPPLAPTPLAEVPGEALALRVCEAAGRADPAELLPGIRGLEPPLGSACCGARLPEVPDTEGLDGAMARGMLSPAEDGAVVAVCDPRCAAQLAASAEGRVRVIYVEGAKP